MIRLRPPDGRPAIRPRRLGLAVCGMLALMSSSLLGEPSVVKTTDGNTYRGDTTAAGRTECAGEASADQRGYRGHSPGRAQADGYRGENPFRRRRQAPVCRKPEYSPARLSFADAGRTGAADHVGRR